MDQSSEEKLRKMLEFSQDPELASFDELRTIADILRAVVNKLDIPAPVVNVPAPVVNVEPPIVNVPAPIINIEKADMSETNNLLRKLTDKENGPIDITLELV